MKKLVSRLVSYLILRFDVREHTYTTHPLIRNHYLALLTKGDAAHEKAAHEQIKDYYLSIAGDTPQYPTLNDLKPLIEVVHHACQAGVYDDAWDIYRKRVDQGDRGVLVYELGAYETVLALMLEFFPNSDTSREPRMLAPGTRSWILNEVGLSLMYLGRLGEALPFYKRVVASFVIVRDTDWGNVSIGYQNLASLHIYLGELMASAKSSEQALDRARRAESNHNEEISLAFQARVAHLCGDLEKASSAFRQAEKLESDKDLTTRDYYYLYSSRGVFHADHLRRTGNADYARRVTEANLIICEQEHWAGQLRCCHRVLGDVDADTGQHDSARAHYDTALKIARSISYRPALIEVLPARGRWAARYVKDVASAFNELNEALGYAVEGGYRIYEADIRVALAWANLTPIPSPSPVDTVDREREQARVEAERALQMGKEMGYYWGKVDAEEVLKVIRET